METKSEKAQLTSKIGCGVLLFNTSRSRVALVFEHSKWKMVTGTCELGERVSETAIRETKEEVGVQVDPENLHEVGFLNTGTPKENYFLVVYEAVVKEETLKPDG